MDAVEGNTLGAAGTPQGLALTLAVIYHGFACLPDGSVPAATRTIIHTADVFEAHLLKQSGSIE